MSDNLKGAFNKRLLNIQSFVDGMLCRFCFRRFNQFNFTPSEYS